MTHSQHLPYGPLNQCYLDRIEATLMASLNTHPRLMVVRIDLRIPDNGQYSDNQLSYDTPTFFMNTGPNLISRFTKSLKAQVTAEQYAKLKKGKRVHPCDINFVWTREYSQNNKPHYHLALFVNRDRYHSLGNKNAPGSFAWIIKKAWASALGLPVDEFSTLVHIPENPIYALNHNAPHQMFLEQLYPVLNRLSYLAKEKTKIYGTGQRNFGCSNPKKMVLRG
ncbi:inovirus Gp2 family protein [Ferrimonas aestuarii]|uniref:Inovirus Gp2 family protein n=1 Tax=Ferrimonas aestuarii TaxID=2569539 RepID=A0A4U1BQ83_9GAMM|nr:inovirus Gp2 family protein [Ferrimonas aestuarii]TKB56304.1 inovirus Gp2 family protein [Ferrimonas aestuarii]